MSTKTLLCCSVTFADWPIAGAQKTASINNRSSGGRNLDEFLLDNFYMESTLTTDQDGFRAKC